MVNLSQETKNEKVLDEVKQDFIQILKVKKVIEKSRLKPKK